MALRIDGRMAAFVFLLLVGAAMAAAQETPEGALKNLPPLPAQPGEETWRFVEDLKTPMWTDHRWRSRAPESTEADLRGGVRIEAKFSDSENLLKTAYADLSDFLAAGKMSQDGKYVLETMQAKTPVFEAFRVEVTAERCRIIANDTEGIRRGMFWVEDAMLRAGGPFLPLGTVERKPFIKARISRCFFGPIHRPPKNRDELMDDVDYYPDQYLNRMTHEGVNGLWLSVRFKDLCKTAVTPEFGDHVEQRLAKLRKTVEKCRRYGIAIYLFTNEPEGWGPSSPLLKNHPELASDCKSPKFFCPSTEAAQKFLYEATHFLFSSVPHLGGMINITHGEATTSCLTVVGSNANNPPACRRCAEKGSAAVIAEILEPMGRGMHDANPDADLIAWLYMPQETGELGDWVYDIPKHLPKNVTLQFNFESGVRREDFGRGRKGGDYWLSPAGPSQRFEQMAYCSQRSGVAMAAKIQTGCSHELATVPFVPAPGLLYRKFHAMHQLGVSRVMLCWYFGNYPGVMNRAAGELSFEPFPKTEDEFLRNLAASDWGSHAGEMAHAWQLFAEGYGHYPLTNWFQYWGPIHDGVVWPLLLHPQDAPLAPTWQIASWSSAHPFAASGDRVGESLGSAYTLPEAVELCRKMSDRWNEGLLALKPLEADATISEERRLDLGVARAVGIQLRSGYNILRFYDLREQLAHETKLAEQLATLGEMRKIVVEEIANDRELIALCRRDSRLGFHSEAEGYKYFPAKIQWRIDQLQCLLDSEMPAMQKDFERGVDVFAEYAGRRPKGPSVRSLFCADIAARLKERDSAGNQALPAGLVWQTFGTATNSPRWACCHDHAAFYFLFDGRASQWSVSVEPRRMWLCTEFHLSGGDAHTTWPPCEWTSHLRPGGNGTQGWMRVPFVSLNKEPAQPKAMRINVRCTAADGVHDWIPRHPWLYRLLLSNGNPADLGWLFFDDKQ